MACRIFCNIGQLIDLMKDHSSLSLKMPSSSSSRAANKLSQMLSRLSSFFTSLNSFFISPVLATSSSETFPFPVCVGRMWMLLIGDFICCLGALGLPDPGFGLGLLLLKLTSANFTCTLGSSTRSASSSSIMIAVSSSSSLQS